MSLSESRFYMWRAVAAMIHADDMVLPHEINFIIESTRDLPLSDEQRAILTWDMGHPGDIEAHFTKITHPRDKEDFFYLARAISWSDGEFDEREKALLRKVRVIPMGGGDSEIMENALKNFKGLYIEGGVDKKESSDPSFISVIKGLLRIKAA